MAILKVANLGNPILRIPAEPVKNIQAPDIQRLIDDMIETMREYHGVGLAAPQVHRALQIVTIEAEQEDGASATLPSSPTILKRRPIGLSRPKCRRANASLTRT